VTPNGLFAEPSGKVCPICGSKGRLVKEFKDYPIYECDGILLSWQYKDEKTYENWYKCPEGFHLTEPERLERGQYKTLERYEEDRQAAFKRVEVMRSLGLHGAPNGLLDIGAGSGAFVEAANDCGWLASGLEMNPELCNSKVQQGSWKYIENFLKFDIIAMHDVFEHLTRPNECLAEIRKHLTKDGVLIIEQPEWDGDLKNRHIKPLQHPCMYSKEAAETLYERHGYRTIAFYRPLKGTLQKMAHFLLAKG